MTHMQRFLLLALANPTTQGGGSAPATSSAGQTHRQKGDTYNVIITKCLRLRIGPAGDKDNGHLKVAFDNIIGKQIQ